MFFKSLLFTALLGFSCASATVAQAETLVDPSVSTHNYKHPNKAAHARLHASGRIMKARTRNMATYSKAHQGVAVTTPRYAPRTASLVVFTSENKHKPGINPLISDRHYKAGRNDAAGTGAALMSEAL